MVEQPFWEREDSADGSRRIKATTGDKLDAGRWSKARKRLLWPYPPVAAKSFWLTIRGGQDRIRGDRLTVGTAEAALANIAGDPAKGATFVGHTADVGIAFRPSRGIQVGAPG